MTYSLYRIRDNAGDSGQMSDAYFWREGAEGYPEIIHDSKPFVGAVMRVGSLYARTYSHQDWWQTTKVTEILEEWGEEDNIECVRFKTGNSEYIWKKF